MSTEKSPTYRVIFERSEYSGAPLFSLQRLTTITPEKKFLRKTESYQTWKSIQYFYVDYDRDLAFDIAAFEATKDKAVLALKAYAQYDGLVIYP